jgi:Ricin-type beta-trefoil lectin domain-like
VRPTKNIAILVLVGAATYACTVKEYPFFPEPVASGGASACAGDDCGAGGASVGGSQATGGMAGSGDSSGGGPASVPDNCEIPSTGALAERIVIEDSGLCLGRGEFVALAGATLAYRVVATACSTDIRQMWIFEDSGTDVFGLRNYSVDLKLDVQYAGTAVPTPVVLYETVPGDHQRFRVRPLDEGTFKLSPMHDPTKCVSAGDGILQTRPCDDDTPGQVLRRVECN